MAEQAALRVLIGSPQLVAALERLTVGGEVTRQRHPGADRDRATARLRSELEPAALLLEGLLLEPQAASRIAAATAKPTERRDLPKIVLIIPFPPLRAGDCAPAIVCIAQHIALV